MAKGLTKRREMFLEGLMQGKSQRQSYIAAYPNAAKWAPEAVDAKASNLLKTDKVWIRYTELQAAAAKANEVSRDSLVRELKGIAFADIDTEKVKAGDLMRYKIEAMKLLAKICGFDEPDGNDKEDAGPDPMSAVLEQIREVCGS